MSGIAGVMSRLLAASYLVGFGSGAPSLFNTFNTVQHSSFLTCTRPVDLRLLWGVYESLIKEERGGSNFTSMVPGPLGPPYEPLSLNENYKPQLVEISMLNPLPLPLNIQPTSTSLENSEYITGLQNRCIIL